jgi:hypothetical protein
VGIVAVASGLAWHFTEPSGAGGSAKATPGTQLAPVVAPGFAGLSLGGSF